jgi:hypothetical protein
LLIRLVSPCIASGVPVHRHLVTAFVIRGLSLAVAAAALLGGCSSGITGGTSGVRPDARSGPDPLRAQVVARREFGLLSGGGWAQAWSLWTAGAQRAVSQADFVHVNAACRTWLGVPYQIQDAVSENGTTVRISWRRGDETGESEISYQAGAWRFVPDPATLAVYRLGVDGGLAALRREHACRG